MCLLSIGDLKVNVSSGRMSLRTAATKKRENLKAILYVFAECNECVFFTYRTPDSKCFFRSYVFVDCGYEEKRKSKSNIVCLCGLQWLGFSRIGHLTVNVSSARMSLRTAATKTRENLKALLYVFADCKHEAQRARKEC